MHGNKEKRKNMNNWDKVKRCLSEIDRLNSRVDELEKLLAHANKLLDVERATTDTILDRMEDSTNS